MTRARLHGASLPLLLVGLACASPPAPAPPVPTVEYAGCRQVFEPGTVCVLRSKRELRLWVESRRIDEFEVRVDGKGLDAARLPVREGHRFTLIVPKGAKSVEVVAAASPRSARWFLHLGEAPAEASTSRVQQAPRTPPRDVVEEVDSKTLLAYRQLVGRDLVGARATLSELRLPAKAPAESRYLASYYRGALAEREGDYRSALAEVQKAVEIAERVKPERHLWIAEEELALLLRGVGRSRDAAELFDRLRRTPYAGSACEEAQLLNNLAWSTLLAREAGEVSEDPTHLLEEARAKWTSCADAKPEQKVNTAINLVLAHLQERRVERAKAILAAARTIEPHPPVPHLLWRLDLEGRIALEERRAEEALRGFRALQDLATETSSFDASLRAALGEARAYQALGDSIEALDVLSRAEALLDEQSLQVPVNEGRETFLAARQSLVALHLDLLLDQGRTRDAMELARHARARLLRQLAHVDSLASLSPEARARRARLLTAYQQRRAAIEERARDDWKLPADELRRERAARKSEAQALKGLLDEAYLTLGTAGDRAGAERAPLPGELFLVYQVLSGPRWVAFAADRDGVSAHRFELADTESPPPAALSNRLLVPFRRQIARATRIRILATGRLERVDFHSLPFEGPPLLASRQVVYGLDLPSTPSLGRSTGRTALVVADPRGDLPGARREARAVRAALISTPSAWSVAALEETEASAEGVGSRLARSDLLHYAGHGDYAGFGGWESSLLLAGETRLTLGDLLAFQRVPRWVVLSGCDTGRASDRTAVASLGLAHAFLLAGSREVVASTRPTDDRAVPAFFTELYRQWGTEPDLARAMQRAQLAWRDRDPTADWASFRLFER